MKVTNRKARGPTMIKHRQRRELFRLGGAALALLAVSAATVASADAAINTALRTSLQYRGEPEGEMRCANCMQFIPGTSAQELGACKIMAGDTEISPQGYCLAWVKKP